MVTSLPDNPRIIALFLQLARALHTYGAPAHQLEEALSQVAGRFGIAGQFLSTPTSLVAAFGPAGEQRLALERIEPGEVNLDKLSQLYALMDAVASGEVDVEAAGREVARITGSPSRYRAPVFVLAHGLVSFSAAVFLGGGWRDLAVAAGMGSAIGLLVFLAERLRSNNRLLELIAASGVAFGATALGVRMESLSVLLVVIASLVVLLPGLNVTVAMNELATRHLVAGSSRLAGTSIVFLTLAFGIALGTALAHRWIGIPEPFEPVPTPLWMYGPALLASTAGLLVTLRARPTDSAGIFLAGAIAIVGAKLGAAAAGPEVGPLVASFLLGLASNVFARLTRRPAAVIQVPGLMLLVPGSIGLSSVSAMLERETIAGVQGAFAVVLVAFSLVTGLLVANAVLPPRGELRRPAQS